MDIIKLLEQKDSNDRADFVKKQKILRMNFGNTAETIIRSIKIQRDLV